MTAVKLKYTLYVIIIFTFFIFLISSCVTTGPPEAPKIIKSNKGGFYHRIVCGEDLFEISRKYEISIHYLAKINNIKNYDRLQPGTYLYIPPKETPVNQKTKVVTGGIAGSSSTVSAAGANSETKKTTNPTKQTTNTKFKPTEKKFIWPLNGKVSRGYSDNESSRHKGVDILAATGSPIVAARSGVVIYEGNSMPGYGNMIIIDHGDQYATLYGHNKTNLVRVNQKVKQGETIALVGMTGRATAPHLHFEIRENAVAIDPAPHLP